VRATPRPLLEDRGDRVRHLELTALDVVLDPLLEGEPVPVRRGEREADVSGRVGVEPREGEARRVELTPRVLQGEPQRLDGVDPTDAAPPRLRDALDEDRASPVTARPRVFPPLAEGVARALRDAAR
jgi:hypothetical protein